MALGGSLIGLAIATSSINNTSVGGAISGIILGVIGGFHLASGVGLTAGAVVLLKRAQKQSGTGAIYLRIPALEMNEGLKKNKGYGVGINTALVF